MKRVRQRKAFTMIEMVIVIAVIAILATVLVPTISGVIQKANHSADQQFAASLNIQLAMYGVDKPIESESDLRDAINSFYAEKDDDGNVIGDFYATLAPKSGAQGYHYWWNATDKQIVLAKFEDLDSETDEGAPVLFAEIENKPTFSAASPRSLRIDGKDFFLMDQAGSDVAEQLKALDSIGANADYGTAVEQIKAIESDNALALKLAEKLTTTAIANDQGMFFYGEWGTKATEVYIPYGTEVLGSSKVDPTLLDVAEIYLPDSIKSIGDGSLLGFTVVKDDEIWTGSTTIYFDATEDQLSSIVSTGSFNCVIQIPTGDRFAFVDDVLTNLVTNETIETEYSVELKKFDVSSTDVSSTNDFHFLEDRTKVHTLHITGDTESVTLKAENFVDQNENTTSRPVTWKDGDAVLGNAASMTLTGDALTDGNTITVTAQNLTYNIQVVLVAIDTFEATFGGQTGEPDNNNGILTYKLELEYKKGYTWQVAPTVTPTTSCVNISFDSDVTLALSGDGASNLDIDGKTVKVKDSATGNFSATLTVTTKEKGTDGNAMSIVFDLTFKMASSTFEIADNANTQVNYDIKFTVGTVQPIKLGTLFKLVEGEPSNVQVTWSNNGGAATPFTFTSQSGDWTNWEITPTQAGDNFAISISDGGATCTLNVKVVSGAYNVATYEQWVSATGKICLLADIDLGNNFDTQNKTLTYMQGNMHVIDASQFNYKDSTHNNCYLIKMTSGTFDSAVIVGPVYPEVVLSSKSGSTGDGYFAPGLRLSGTVTVSNSYISGFYAPVRVDGGNITIKKTTLEGGISSNIYIYNATTVTLEDSITVQRRGGYTETYTGKNKQVIGAGIHLDTKANGTKVVFTGTTKQYNWFASTDGYSGTVETIRGYLFDGDQNCETDEFEYTYSDFIHMIDGTAFIDMGITQEKESYSITEETELDKVLEVKNVLKGVTYLAWSHRSCGASCSHDLNPADANGDGVYSYLDFIASRRVN